jgi:glycosyltransferase involved in cell wall biosynthesis
MATGRPSIATRAGGPETIIDADTGILVDVGDVAALADALKDVFRHPGRFDGETIRARFAARFGRATTVDRLEQTLRRAIARHRGEEERPCASA